MKDEWRESPEQQEVTRTFKILEDIPEYKTFDEAITERVAAFNFVDKCISDKEKHAAIKVWEDALDNEKRLEAILNNTDEWHAFNKACSNRDYVWEKKDE